jgi:hypothetical protein
MALSRHQPITPQVCTPSQFKNCGVIGCAELEEHDLVDRDKSARNKRRVVVAQLGESPTNGVDVDGRHPGPIALHQKSAHVPTVGAPHVRR